MGGIDCDRRRSIHHRDGLATGRGAGGTMNTRRGSRVRLFRPRGGRRLLTFIGSRVERVIHVLVHVPSADRARPPRQSPAMLIALALPWLLLGAAAGGRW